MKIDKIGSLEFVELDLMDMQKLGLMGFSVCPMYRIFPVAGSL